MGHDRVVLIDQFGDVVLVRLAIVSPGIVILSALGATLLVLGPVGMLSWPVSDWV